jgi:hypothetical protein
MNPRASIFLVALAAAGACSTSGGGAPATSTTSTTHRMTFEECQASATYPGGGRYAVEYDNGVCKVQKP